MIVSIADRTGRSRLLAAAAIRRRASVPGRYRWLPAPQDWHGEFGCLRAKKRARQRPAGLFVTLREEGARRYAANGLENFSTVALTRALIGAIASLVTFTPISDSLELSATSESKVDLA